MSQQSNDDIQWPDRSKSAASARDSRGLAVAVGVIQTLFNWELVCTVCFQSLLFCGKCFPLYICNSFPLYIQNMNWIYFFFLMWVLLSCSDEPRYKDVCGTAVLHSMLQAGVFKIRGRKCSIEVVKWQVWMWYEEGAACDAWLDCQSPRRVCCKIPLSLSVLETHKENWTWSERSRICRVATEVCVLFFFNYFFLRSIEIFKL